MANHKNRINVVYSTNPNFNYETEHEEEKVSLPPAQQKLYIELDRKARAGKQVTLLTGFYGSKKDLETLAKQLKNICGAGGGTDGDAIIVQGDHREKIIAHLIKQGYSVKKRGG